METEHYKESKLFVKSFRGSLLENQEIKYP